MKLQLTLAIKKGGFYKSMQKLLSYGAKIPCDRLETLQQFAVEQGFQRTAQALLTLPPSSTSEEDTKNTLSSHLKPSSDMSVKYLRLLFETGSSSLMELLEPVLSKGSDGFGLFQNIVAKIKEDKILVSDSFFNESFILKYAFPPKLDDPLTKNYLEITQFFLDYGAHFTGASLFRAVETGKFTSCEIYFRFKTFTCRRTFRMEK